MKAPRFFTAGLQYDARGPRPKVSVDIITLDYILLNDFFA